MLGADAQLLTEAGTVPAARAREGARLLGVGPLGPGPQELASLEYRAAPPEMIELETSGGRALRLSPDHPMLGRFRPGDNPWDVILVKEVGLGAALICGRGGLRELGDRRVTYAHGEAEGERSEEIFLLSAHPTEADARLQSKLWAARFGLPESTGGYRDLSREAWRQLFLEVDTLGRAYDLLEGLGLDTREPHWVRRHLDGAALRRLLLVEAVHRHGAWDLWIRKPEVVRGKRRRAHQERETQRVADLSSFERLGHVDLERRVDLGNGVEFRVLSAAGLHAGMSVPVWERARLGEDRVRSVRRVPGKGLVYRLDCPDALALLVEGVVVGSHGSPLVPRRSPGLVPTVVREPILGEAR